MVENGMVDWDEIGEGFEPVPAAEYPLRVIGLEPTTAKTGTAQWNGQFLIIDGKYEGRYIWIFLVVDPSTKALWKVKSLAKAAGITLKGQMTAEEVEKRLEEVREELIDQEVIGVVIQEVQKKGMRQGEMRNNIARFLPLE